MLTLVNHSKAEAEAAGLKVIAEVDMLSVPMITDRINVTTLQAVVRYKYGLEVGPTHRGHRLEFAFSADSSQINVRVDGVLALVGDLAPSYANPAQRALAHVENLRHAVSGVEIPVTHQSHTLAKLYEHPLMEKS